MASKRIVSCVTLSPGTTSARAGMIGGFHPDGRWWSLSADAAMAGIERGEWAFYVEVATGLVPVTVRGTGTGDRYLSADSDGAGTDPLASLQKCPR